MSVQASIEIEFSNLPQDHKNTDLIKILLDGGWTLNDYGGVSYLPIGDDDFDWIINAQISQNELMKILEEKEKLNECIGIVMTWKSTAIGGSFMFQKLQQFSVLLNVNRKIISDDNNITDASWYLSRLIPILEKNGIYISYFAFEQLT